MDIRRLTTFGNWLSLLHHAIPISKPLASRHVRGSEILAVLSLFGTLLCVRALCFLPCRSGLPLVSHYAKHFAAWTEYHICRLTTSILQQIDTSALDRDCGSDDGSSQCSQDSFAWLDAPDGTIWQWFTAPETVESLNKRWGRKIKAFDKQASSIEVQVLKLKMQMDNHRSRLQRLNVALEQESFDEDITSQALDAYDLHHTSQRYVDQVYARVRHLSRIVRQLRHSLFRLVHEDRDELEASSHFHAELDVQNDDRRELAWNHKLHKAQFLETLKLPRIDKATEHEQTPKGVQSSSDESQYQGRPTSRVNNHFRRGRCSPTNVGKLLEKAGELKALTTPQSQKETSFFEIPLGSLSPVRRAQSPVQEENIVSDKTPPNEKLGLEQTIDSHAPQIGEEMMRSFATSPLSTILEGSETSGKANRDSKVPNKATAHSLPPSPASSPDALSPQDFYKSKIAKWQDLKGPQSQKEVLPSHSGTCHLGRSASRNVSGSTDEIYFERMVSAINSDVLPSISVSMHGDTAPEEIIHTSGLHNKTESPKASRMMKTHKKLFTENEKDDGGPLTRQGGRIQPIMVKTLTESAVKTTASGPLLKRETSPTLPKSAKNSVNETNGIVSGSSRQLESFIKMWREKDEESSSGSEYSNEDLAKSPDERSNAGDRVLETPSPKAVSIRVSSESPPPYTVSGQSMDEDAVKKALEHMNRERRGDEELKVKPETKDSPKKTPSKIPVVYRSHRVSSPPKRPRFVHPYARHGSSDLSPRRRNSTRTAPLDQHSLDEGDESTPGVQTRQKSHSMPHLSPTDWPPLPTLANRSARKDSKSENVESVGTTKNGEQPSQQKFISPSRASRIPTRDSPDLKSGSPVYTPRKSAIKIARAEWYKNIHSDESDDHDHSPETDKGFF